MQARSAPLGAFILVAVSRPARCSSDDAYTRLDVTVPGWPAGAPGLRIAVLADFHAGGPHVTPARLAGIVAIDLGLNPVPATTNPLGAKGAGEAGVSGSCPAVMTALLDALGPLGVGQLDMPATPERVWRAIAGASQGR